MSPDALDALVESSWDAAPDGEVPVLVPEDLPAVDGIMLLANPVVVASRRGRVAADLKRNEHLIAVRWSAHSEFLVVQTIHGWSQLEALTDDNDGEPPAADDPDLTVPGSALIRPDAWRGPRPTTDIDPAEPGIWGTTRTCGDGSALIVSFSAPMTWQWGRRAEPTGSSDGTIYNEALDGFFADARSSGAWARFAAASGFAGNNPGSQIWDRLKNAARLGILEQANEFTAGMEKTGCDLTHSCFDATDPELRRGAVAGDAATARRRRHAPSRGATSAGVLSRRSVAGAPDALPLGVRFGTVAGQHPATRHARHPQSPPPQQCCRHRRDQGRGAARSPSSRRRRRHPRPPQTPPTASSTRPLATAMAPVSANTPPQMDRTASAGRTTPRRRNSTNDTHSAQRATAALMR